MRTIALLISIATLELAAQDPLRIWGLTPNGGANDKGTVFRVDADGSNFVTVFDFTDESGWGPEGGLCLAPNGLLYGLTTFGGEGAPAAGTLFTIDPADGTFNKLRDFNLGNGGFNWSTLITGTDGLLYGAGYAGSDGGGSIYRVDPTTNEYTELYALDQATDGGAITGRLLQAADGLFYGTASQGGASGEAGTIFRYNAVTDLFTKLHDFDSALGGRTPYGGVCEAGNGWFYGTTYTGGLSDRGIIYKYNAVTDEFVKIHDMVEDDGSNCWNTLLRLGPDLLIGGVANGSLNSGGYLVTVVPSTDAVTVVWNGSLANGANPMGDLVVGPDGQIYGLLSQGGSGFFGTLSRFSPITFQHTVLHNFTNGADGGLPRGEPLVISAAVGVDEVRGQPFFSIGPNPSAGEVIIRCDPAHLPAQARVADALGRTVRTMTITNASTTLHLGAQHGMHSITITCGAGSYTERLVVE
ncbi:MAG: hypothetical protein KA352_09530 [Flavobacteriales bacterium]|nr:hypothetical protein [Flavobacteriales bacterium]